SSRSVESADTHRAAIQGCRNSPDARAPIMQRPRAHIRRQGAAETISGATPRAASQSQPRVTPELATASPAAATIRQSPIQERTTSGRNVAVEQHERMGGIFASPGLGVSLSKLSMIVALASSDPRQDREVVEQPVGKARELAGEDSDAHAGDDCTRAELQGLAKPTKTSEA